jgi:hypothetical protein
MTLGTIGPALSGSPLYAQFERWFLGDDEVARTAGIPNCLTVLQVSKIFGISVRSTYQLIREKKLPAIQLQIGGAIIIPIPMLFKVLVGELPMSEPADLGRRRTPVRVRTGGRKRAS